MGNFIKVDRKILKWEWWGDVNTFRLFMYMLINAWWRDGNYKGVDISRGSFPSSINELAKDTNLTENEVRTALKHLKSTGEITSKSTNKFTVFTVNNYNSYQTDNEQEHKQITNKSQANHKQITSTILKEDKNERSKEYINNTHNINNINNIHNNNLLCSTKSSDSVRSEEEKNFEIIYNSYPKKVGKAKGYEYYRQWLKGRDISGRRIKLTNRQIWSAIAKYKHQLEENETEKQYIKDFSTFMCKAILDYVEDGT